MKSKSYSTSFRVSQSPEQVFAAISNPRAWWSEDADGNPDRLGAEFQHRHEDVHHCTLKVTEFDPGRRVVWHVVENFFSFLKDQNEWKGTDIVFDISRDAKSTLVRFQHAGLVPSHECYGLCSSAWHSVIGSSLRDLIATGAGQPESKGG
jgi:uncharacterized protein YndB with AHSA1/START domain